MPLPKTMRAVEITEHGGPEVLQLCQRPVPDAGPGEVVIRLAFAGVNRPDALQRAGLYAPPPTASDLPGLEGAGEVVAVGADVADLKPGDQVCALLPGGGYAEYVATPAAHCLPVPAGMSLEQAACLPETFYTVWSNVFMRGGLKKGETFAKSCPEMKVIATRAAPRPRWGVVVAGGRSRRAALIAFERARRKMPALISNAKLVVVKKRKRAAGPVYTARLGAGGKGEAARICLRIRKAGGACYVRRN